jgi:bifunctional aspartokinase / homoserine dehydrogenase 1
MLVLKFGGTSVGSVEALKQVMDIIMDRCASEEKIAVVVSAFKGVTDQLGYLGKSAAEGQKQHVASLQRLQDLHQEVIESLIEPVQGKETLATVDFLFSQLGQILHGIYLVNELSNKTLDYILSFGERLSALILTAALKERIPEVSYLDARDVIVTNNEFNNAVVSLEDTYSNIQKHFEFIEKLVIATGFIASTKEGATTTLGRGGSDYTASLFAAALEARELQIWTDVDGVMTADPRKVSQAFTIPSLSYEEAMEMSHFGAKVIHPPTMHPIFTKKIPLSIKNTFFPQNKGTLITQEAESGRGWIRGLSSIERVSLLRVQGSGMIGICGSSMRIFSVLARENVNVILISQASSEHSICFAISPKDAAKAKESIEQEFHFEINAHQMEPVQIETNLSVIAIVGEKMRQTPGISSRLFSSLGANGINVIAIAQGSSELNISVVIKKNDEAKALKAIHDTFFLSQTRRINLFIVGLGLIGDTLISQILAQKSKICEEMSLEINVVGMMNTKKMLFEEQGISLENWKETLGQKGKPSTLRAFVTKMKEYNLPCSVFIDATPSDDPVEFYEEVFNANISIATPNKKANSADFELYKRLKETARKRGVVFAYETNVGAGLPVIGTLRDLIQSGDQILKIEAVLSGTLSFIFNEFSKDQLFTQVVKNAKSLGYTEPDPREDLNGMDAARKLLILIRECGFALEMEQLNLEGLLDEKSLQADSVEKFFEVLADRNQEFEDKRQQAELEGKRLRYVATFDRKTADVSLKAVDATHPFYNLSGTDNMIVFTTQRYQDTPLVIRGPGAGAEVTAAGVFSDFMKSATIGGQS